MHVKKGQLELDMEQQTGSKLEYVTLLINLYAEHIIRNAGLDEAQCGIKIARRNISYPTHGYDTTLMAEGEEELKSVLMKLKEESENVG